MKKKRIIFFTIAFILCLSIVGIVTHKKIFAGTAQLHIEVPDTVKKETEFKVKLVLDSDVDLYSIDAYLSYNHEVMEFVPDSEYVTGTAGVLELKDTYQEETKNAVYEITFKALDTGKAEIALTEVYLIDYDNLEYLEVIPSLKHFDITVNKKTETDARLSELMIAPGELNEAFHPDLYQYEMHVDLDVTEVGITAIPKEKDSIVHLDMPEKLKRGENTILITVTSLSGKTNTYTITVYREEIQQEVTTEIEEVATEQTTTEIEETEEISTENIEENTTEILKESKDTTTEVIEEATTEILN